ncbi:uncharacterized protein LOC115694311 [Syzygium oleosum]|uniref:uncharacterized protein LOC115694311 n=1 Tax=Syzygium oleosum TaxID=219896 RepID=UPI0024BA49D9|nr:uncharacterized protein LOC115694311 [Syzygium oleosum]
MRDLQGSRVVTGNQIITQATVVVERLQTPEGMLALIELYVGSVAFLLLFLAAFGSLRRRNNNPMLKVVLWAAYTLSGYLITYTLGLMRESPFRNPLFPLWATFLMIFLGSSNSFSAYSLEDNEQWKNYAWQHLVTFIGLLTLWTLYLTTMPSRLAVFLLYFVLLVLKTTERALSLVPVSVFGRHRLIKWVADHMSSKRRCPDPSEVDPITMKGYKYVVKMSRTLLEKIFGEVGAPKPNSNMVSEDYEEEVITIEKVWACKGRLLSSSGGDRDDKLKDICLSYALYLLLRLKFSRYLLPEEAHQTAWRLIREGILQKEDDGSERAFRVAEVELTFLHDFFYTNYPVIFQARLWPLKVVELLCLIMGTMLTVVFLMPKTTKPQGIFVQLVTSDGLSIDVLMTAVFLLVFICVELVQLFLMAISDWAKLRWLCNYVKKESWHGNKPMEKLIGLICRVRLKPWERKLRQYSFLESYNYVPSRLLYNFCTINFIDVVRSGQKQGAPVELSNEVKKAVFHSLKNSNGKLENGQASLRLNNVSDELSWACQLKTQTRVIMVWHIATSFLEHERPSNEDPNFHVATNLSKYLAYLVAFAPRLLPDHLYDAENVFDQITREAREVLEGYKKYEARIKRLTEIAKEPEDPDTVMNRGAWLGNQLLGKDVQLIWKILAEFWAELTLYVAPSDDAKAHVEHLVMGGEFVTHLWALVSHAGLQRKPLSDANMA